KTTGGVAITGIKDDLENAANNDKNLQDAMDQVRLEIETSGNILKAINHSYESLSRNNAIAGSSNVYPKGFADFMKANPDWKMLADQLKFGVALKSAEIDKSGGYVGAKVETLSNMIEDYMSNKGKGVVRVCGLNACRWGNLVGK